MLSPRLTNCVDCASIPSLLQDIDCKIASIAKDLYNNTIFSLNRSINGTVMSDLINYRRILRYRYCNSNYASPYTIEQIASKVKLLTNGCCPCSIQPTVITGTICTAGGYWYNTIAPDEAAYYPESMEIDESCNVYSLSEVNDDSSSTSYRKFDATGTLVWEKTQSNNCSAYPSEMKIDSDGNIYIVYNNGIRKVDTDGNTVWEKYWDIDVNVIGINLDGLGNLFVSLSGDDYVYLAKLSTSTGTVIAQKVINITNANDIYTDNAPLVDSLGNILIAVAYYDNEYFTTIIKFTNDLSTVIWDARLDQADFGNDCDLTGFQIDANNNVYGCNYGTSIFKINADGTFAWARTLTGEGVSSYINNGIYALAVSPEGDVFWVGDAYDCDWRNDCIIDANYIVVNKFDTDGNYQWSTAIGSDDNPYFDMYLASWSYSEDAAKIRNGILMIVGYNNSGNENEYLFKLPLTQVTPAKYGEQYFYDITSYLTAESITSTILTSTYTVSSTGILDTPVSCIFVDSTPTLNITNTIIS